MMRFLLRLLSDRSGASAIEYAFLAALVALAIVAAVGALGVEVNSAFTKAKDAFPS